MSISIREHVANNLVLQNAHEQYSQFTATLDGVFLLDTRLIAFLNSLISLELNFLVTSLRTDHSLDVGPLGHAHGHAVDGWFLGSKNAEDYLAADSDEFYRALSIASKNANVQGVGLAGEAYTARNMVATQGKGFIDSGTGPHLHFQVY